MFQGTSARGETSGVVAMSQASFDIDKSGHAARNDEQGDEMADTRRDEQGRRNAAMNTDIEHSTRTLGAQSSQASSTLSPAHFLTSLSLAAPSGPARSRPSEPFSFASDSSLSAGTSSPSSAASGSPAQAPSSTSDNSTRVGTLLQMF